MKKSSIALYAAAVLFLVCSFTFLPDKIAEFVSDVAIAAVLAFFGYRQQKKPAAAKEEEAPVPAPQSARTNESDFPFSVKINGASISVSDAPPIETPVNKRSARPLRRHCSTSAAGRESHHSGLFRNCSFAQASQFSAVQEEQ